MGRAETSTKVSVSWRISSMPSAQVSIDSRCVTIRSLSGCVAGHGLRSAHLTISPSSTPSMLTSTTSSRRVGRFLPT